MGEDNAEQALIELQQLVQRENHQPDLASLARNRRIPDDLADENNQMLALDFEEEQAFQATKQVLADDLRFEHLVRRVGDPLDDQVWRFICKSALSPLDDHVLVFLEQNVQAPEDRVCFFPVEWLTVQEPVELAGVRFLPPSSEEIPPEEPFFSLGQPVGAVISIPIRGTNLMLMKERAEPIADRALQILRVVLSATVPGMQLRFRLADSYSFGERLAGWQMAPNAGTDLTLHEDLIELARSHPISSLAGPVENDLRRKADRAVRWIADAELAIDPTIGLLFRFFALEAMFGGKKQRWKARGLAFRRAMLGVATTGTFTHPYRAYWLYSEVRNAAVHGEDPPEYDSDESHRFGWDVREALTQYLGLAAKEGLKTQQDLLCFLKRHPEHQRLMDWLVEQPDGPEWEKYFDSEG